MKKYGIVVIHGIGAFLLILLCFVAETNLFKIVSVLGCVFMGMIGQLIWNKTLVEYKNDKNKLSQELAVASGSIKSVSAEIELTVDESNTYSKTLFQQSTQMSGQMAEVNEIITKSSVAMKNLVSLTSTTRDMAFQLDKNSRSSELTIFNSKTEIMNVVEVIGTIKQTSGNATNAIETLKETSQKISSMLKEIIGILSNMKLISMNATIEAARAGEAGQGFTAVASEFKNLTQITEVFVKDIEAQILSMNSDVNKVYCDIGQNNECVDRGVAFSKLIEENLKEMSESFQKVIATVEEMNIISNEQSRISDMVGEQMECMEDLVNITSQNADAVYHSALSQKDRVENIAKMSKKLGVASDELSEIADSTIQLPVQFETKEFMDTLHETAQDFFKIIQTELTSHHKFLTNDPNLHDKLLRTFKEAHKEVVEAVWTNDVNGRFFCSIPSASIANATIREWFQGSIGGEQYISKIYISAITRNPCVTLAIPYYSKGGKIIGIIGVDLNLNGLAIKKRK